MKFSELNPQLSDTTAGGNPCQRLRYDCPLCGREVAVLIRRDVDADPSQLIWKMRFEPGRQDFDSITIEPSIERHAVPRKNPPCSAHITVTKGVVEFH